MANQEAEMRITEMLKCTQRWKIRQSKILCRCFSSFTYLLLHIHQYLISSCTK